MRLWPRRKGPAALELQTAEIRLAPVEVRHELRHVYEPRPLPDAVRLLFEVDGRVLQEIWPDVSMEHDLDVPEFITGRQGQPPIRLRLSPLYDPYKRRR